MSGSEVDQYRSPRVGASNGGIVPKSRGDGADDLSMTPQLTSRQLKRLGRAALLIAVGLALYVPFLLLQLRDVALLLAMAGLLNAPLIVLTAVILVIAIGLVVAVLTLRAFTSRRILILSLAFPILLLLQPGSLGHLLVAFSGRLLPWTAPVMSSVYTVLLLVSAVGFVGLLSRLRTAVGGPVRLGRADRTLVTAWLVCVAASGVGDWMWWGMLGGSFRLPASWGVVVFWGSVALAIAKFVLLGWLFVRVLSLRKWLATVERAQHCPQCRYDLRGAPETGCPECGWRRAA